MAEFAKVAHEWVRMCKAYSDAGDCMKCPMVTNPMCGCMSDDNGASEKEIAKAEADIMSWAADHPEPVYPSFAKYLEQFGIIIRRDGAVEADFFKAHEPMSADIAQKLGIEPKEAR